MHINFSRKNFQEVRKTDRLRMEENRNRLKNGLNERLGRSSPKEWEVGELWRVFEDETRRVRMDNCVMQECRCTGNDMVE